jgi:hypothetical protein
MNLTRRTWLGFYNNNELVPYRSVPAFKTLVAIPRVYDYT